jgi:hypothetical protein
MTSSSPPPQPLGEALALVETLMARGHFWEAHEVLEGVWRRLPRGGAARRVQAVIQVAAALHKSVQASQRPDLPLEEGALRILARARGHWAAGEAKLRVPFEVEASVLAALDIAEAWAQAAVLARKAGLPLPARVVGCSVELSAWAEDLANRLPPHQPS